MCNRDLHRVHGEDGRLELVNGMVGVLESDRAWPVLVYMWA